MYFACILIRLEGTSDMKFSHNDKKQFLGIKEFLKGTHFLKLTNDAAFKAYFKFNKELLISLLTNFLPLPTGSIITDIEILDPEISPDILSTKEREKPGKNFILDLRASFERRTPTGSCQTEIVNIEMQTISEPHFTDRTLAYSCRLYSRQIEEGSSYKKLFPVYSLAFINENLKAFNPIKDYYHICNIRRTEAPEVLMSHGLCFVIVELGKFDKNIKQLYNMRESWCYLLKNSYNVGFTEYKTFKDQGGDMAKAVKHLWNLSQNEVLREYLEALDKKERDRISREEFVREEATEKGIKRGIKKGIEKTILKFLDANMTVEKVSEITGFSKEEIHKLQEKSKR